MTRIQRHRCAAALRAAHLNDYQTMLELTIRTAQRRMDAAWRAAQKARHRAAHPYSPEMWKLKYGPAKRARHSAQAD